jgi:hypothetical protein
MEVAMNERILSLYAKKRKYNIIILAIMIAMIAAAVHTNTTFAKMPYSDDGYDSYRDKNGLINALTLLSLCGFFVSYVDMKKFIKYFINNTDYLLRWEYHNGDFLVISLGGLIQHTESPPVKHVKRKFDGVEWGMESLKSVAEDIRDGHLSPASFLPSIKVSTVSNVIPEYITFWGSTKVVLIFVDIESAKQLIIQVFHDARSEFKINYTLTFPVLPEYDFHSTEFEALVLNMSARNSIEYMYLDQEAYASMDDADVETYHDHE